MSKVVELTDQDFRAAIEAGLETCISSQREVMNNAIREHSQRVRSVLKPRG